MENGHIVEATTVPHTKKTHSIEHLTFNFSRHLKVSSHAELYLTVLFILCLLNPEVIYNIQSLFTVVRVK